MFTRRDLVKCSISLQKFIKINCLGDSGKYPEFVAELPWFKQQLENSENLERVLFFPSTKQKLTEFVDRTINGGEVDVQVWTKMFMCSPVSEEFMTEVPDDFKIQPVMIIIGYCEISYSKISKISPYYEALYKNDYLADIEINHPVISEIIQYFAYPRSRFKSNATEQEIDDILDFLGINLEICPTCNEKKLCICRYEPCEKCNKRACVCMRTRLIQRKNQFKKKSKS